MRAMILAAGRGERMRPLTDHTPKPLLEAGGKPLIVHHIQRLRAAGYSELVINTHHLGNQLVEALGDGHQWQVDIQYSTESPTALETAGGIRHALPLLGPSPFLVINGDIWCDHPLRPPNFKDKLGHLVLVPNPAHNPSGDFGLDGHAVTNQRSFTFSGIGWYHPALFQHLSDNAAAPLGPLLRSAIESGQIEGECFEGCWMDIGTPQRLQTLENYLVSRSV